MVILGNGHLYDEAVKILETLVIKLRIRAEKVIYFPKKDGLLAQDISINTSDVSGNANQSR